MKRPFTLGLLAFLVALHVLQRAVTGQTPATASRKIGTFNPALSPDGTRIAFASDAEGLSSIFVMDVGGGPRLRLTDGTEDAKMPAWSPDGASIVCSVGPNGARRLVRIPSTGGSAVEVPAPAGHNVWPAWSPLGDQIAYNGGTDPRFRRIILTNLRDGRVETVVDEGASNRSPGWRADGQEVIFERDDKDGVTQLLSLNVVTRQVSQLTSHPHDHFQPAVSPDNRSIAVAIRGADQRSHIFLIDRQNGIERKLTSGSGSDFRPVWARDGRAIIFETSRNGLFEIFTIDVASGEQQVLVR